MSKAKGSRAEHKTMRYLEARGYSCTRAAGSMGMWDVIAVSPVLVRLIQVKAGKRPYCPPKERAALEAFKVPQGVIKQLWYWEDYAREPTMILLEPPETRGPF